VIVIRTATTSKAANDCLPIALRLDKAENDFDVLDPQ
jgi:hypothetical protein